MSTKAISEVKKIVSEYFGLKDFFRFRWAELVNDSAIHNIDGRSGTKANGDEIFWHFIQKKKIQPGNKIRLVGFQISSWFPRKPGLYWAEGAKEARDYAMKHHIEKSDKDGIMLDVYGKNLMTELGGIGCVNFVKGKDNICITATSSGDTQQGIPLICSKKVWGSINKDLKNGNPLALDIDGEVVQLPEEQSTLMLRTSGLPRVAVAVRSILNITKIDSSASIKVTPWTVFKTSDLEKPYGFTFVTHDSQEDDMDDSVKWIQNYVSDHRGETIITDFDEELNPLGAIFPLRDVASGNIANEEMLKFLQQIEKDFRMRN